MKTLALATLLLFSLSLFAQTPTPPDYCHPCLFYGGDFDPNGPTPNIAPNSFAKHFPETEQTYVPFFVPPTQEFVISGMFSNNLSVVSVSGYQFQPTRMAWSISMNMGPNQKGTLVAKGFAPMTWTATGRAWFGYDEYTALARLRPADIVTLQTGVYWLTASPMCPDVDPDCQEGRAWITDVEDVPAPNHKGVQPNDDSFVFDPPTWFYAPTYGADGTCTMWYGGAGGCDKFSFGLLGHQQPAQ